MKSVSTVLAHSPVLYDEDLEPFERRACATADAFAELEKVKRLKRCPNARCLFQEVFLTHGVSSKE